MTQSKHMILREALRLTRPFWPTIAMSISIGMLGGLATTWLLATINAALNAPEGLTVPLLFRFAGLCVLSVVGGAVAGIGNSFVGQKIVAALRKDISARILRAPIATIEQRRPHRLLAILAGDIDTISAFTSSFSGYAVAFVVTISGLAYLFYLSPVVFMFATAAAGLGVAINVYSKRSLIRDFENVRNAHDDLQKQYRAITDGAKELRINRTRRAHVHGLSLSNAVDRIANLRTRAMRQFWIVDAATAMIFFALIGLLLVTQSLVGIDASVISSAMLVLLYIKGPINQLVGALPMFGQAEVALRRIAALTEDFADTELKLDDALEYGKSPVRSIELRDASYVFPPAEPGDDGFALGPINLTIEAGETLFIIGENGSGKTTLIKLLLGLYHPTSGALLFNGEPVRDTELDAYRQHFSAVFSDYFLFEGLLADDATSTTKAVEYLERMEIAHKVAIKDNGFSTIDLSTGQRKRLALIHAYIEQRPIVMLDEWAADQDPAFRRIYYTELLPELKAQGKTLIIVSHDDRYFEAADRVIRLECGKVTEDKRLTRPIGIATAAQVSSSTPVAEGMIVARNRLVQSVL